MDEGADVPEPPGPGRTFVVAALAVTLIGAGLLVPREGRQDDPGRFGPDDPAHQLAVLDGARTTEAELGAYAALLDRAEEVCTQGRDRLVGLAADAQRSADDRGARSTTRRLLTTVVGQVGEGRADCAEAFVDAARRAARCEPAGQRPCGY